MARNYAQIFTAIWRDPDFIALKRHQQQAYLLLVTQPNISAAGMLPVTERRWAKMSADGKAADLLADITDLHRVGFVVMDDETEELLVRSFVRHDNGYRNPRRQPSIREAAQEIQSALLRRALAAELVRLGCPAWMPEMAEVVSDDAAKGGATPPEKVFAQVGSHSDSHSDPREHIDVMPTPSAPARTATHNPQPATPNPEPPSEVLFGGDLAEPARPKKRTASPATRIPEDFKVTSAMVAWAVENAPLVNGKRQTEQFIDYWQSATRNATKRNWEAAWRTWMRNAQERAEQYAAPQDRRTGYGGGYADRNAVAVRDQQPRQSAGERKFLRAHELGAELDAELATGGTR